MNLGFDEIGPKIEDLGQWQRVASTTREILSCSRQIDLSASTASQSSRIFDRARSIWLVWIPSQDEITEKSWWQFREAVQLHGKDCLYRVSQTYRTKYWRVPVSDCMPLARSTDASVLRARKANCGSDWLSLSLVHINRELEFIKVMAISSSFSCNSMFFPVVNRSSTLATTFMASSAERETAATHTATATNAEANPMAQTSIPASNGITGSTQYDPEKARYGSASSADKENPDLLKDPNLVSWDGPDDPECPKNWPDNIKWKYTWAVSMFVFISPVSSAMIAPALEDLAASLGMHSQFETYMSLAIFVLAYAVGPVFFGPGSELYGRVLLLKLSNVWYLAWNLGCGFAQTKSQFFAFRFLAGIGGSAPLALGGGAIRYARKFGE